MFLDVVQEYTRSHMGGTRHCSAKHSDDWTRFNACFLGELWNATEYPEYGGPPPPLSSIENALAEVVEVSLEDICQHVSGE